MKYLEELSNGDAFNYDNQTWLITSDFKKNGERLCYSCMDGSARWFISSLIIEPIQLYHLDVNNHVIAIKSNHTN